MVLTLAVIALVLNALLLVGVILIGWRVALMVARVEARVVKVADQAEALVKDAHRAADDAGYLLRHGRRLLGSAAALRIMGRLVGTKQTAGLAAGLSLARVLRHYLTDARRRATVEGEGHERPPRHPDSPL